ncbi:MAG: beta-eliminating lyase-related protein [Defluviicoccus sp.]|nr:beta-eliminating lyase-related protein [Defluviicoccus sp.]
MTGRNFVSDNVAPVHPAVMAAIAAANSGPAASYGEDAISARLDEAFGGLFDAEVRVLPIATGTAANALSIAAMAGPGARFYCHEQAHIAVAEEGAPGFYVAGGECVGVAGELARIDPAALGASLAGAKGGILSLTQATERGTVYSPAQVAALAAIARAAGLRVQLDGARFANAVARLGCHPADIAGRAGVDALVFGTSKNGTLNAEAMVFFDPAFADELFPARKRSGHAYSKMRYLSAQLEAYLADGLWLELAAHANAMARRLADGLAGHPEISLLAPVEANLVFLDMPGWVLEGLRAEGFEIHAARGGASVRLVTSYATTPDDVDRLVEAALPGRSVERRASR